MSTSRDKLAGKTTKLAALHEKLKDHPANLNNFEEGSFHHVDVAVIMPNPDQPRQYFDPDSLKELSVSIKEKGLLQPVIIRKDGNGKIFLVAGERRLKAAKMAGLDRVPAILTNGNPAEIALIENLQREDLKPLEEAEALGRMVQQYGYTQDRLAKALGKAKSTISEALSLNRLPDTVKVEVRRAELYPRRLLVEVAKQDTPEKMLALFQMVKQSALKSADVREITRPPADKKDLSPIAMTLGKVSALQKQLGKLNLTGTDESERAQLLTELQQLKRAIEAIIAKGRQEKARSASAKQRSRQRPKQRR
ncbi:MAG TPA: ParB/RepB/Spo0J family partition protein [Syntrophorhabdales bacterium]|nr:ParB/RepB/Spo0J family partition protein [Syntrophorhabdales bacterium]